MFEGMSGLKGLGIPY